MEVDKLDDPLVSEILSLLRSEGIEATVSPDDKGEIVTKKRSLVEIARLVNPLDFFCDSFERPARIILSKRDGFVVIRHQKVTA